MPLAAWASRSPCPGHRSTHRISVFSVKSCEMVNTSRGKRVAFVARRCVFSRNRAMRMLFCSLVSHGLRFRAQKRRLTEASRPISQVLSVFCWASKAFCRRFAMYRQLYSAFFARFFRSCSCSANSSGVGSGIGTSNLPINFR